jgi:hypothetical protein
MTLMTVRLMHGDGLTKMKLDPAFFIHSTRYSYALGVTVCGIVRDSMDGASFNSTGGIPTILTKGTSNIHSAGPRWHHHSSGGQRRWRMEETAITE